MRPLSLGVLPGGYAGPLAFGHAAIPTGPSADSMFDLAWGVMLFLLRRYVRECGQYPPAGGAGV